MLTSINIGTSGLVGFSKGLETISQNVANLNTPGFKGSSSQFNSLFSAGSENGGTGNGQQGAAGGSGMTATASVLNFGQGQLNQTGKDLDVAIDGNGFFVLKDGDGNTSYTRDGRFSFNEEGILVSAKGEHVQALDAEGKLKDITLEGVRSNPASASATIKLNGTLSTADTTKVVSAINVTDSAGGTHALSVEFKNNTAVTAGSWLVTVKDGSTVVGTGEIKYANGFLDAATANISVNYAPAGVAAMPLTITVDASSTSAASGASSMALASVDGYGIGAMTKTAFDETGTLVVSYSNNQTSKKQTLALANFPTTATLHENGKGAFTSTTPNDVVLGVAKGSADKITGGSLEGSNVDLSKEFSAIIVTQRGYQAASELISTANQMLETLMRMKG